MKNLTGVVLLYIAFSFLCNAQTTIVLSYADNIKLIKNNIELPFAWTGGFNSPQFSTLHANDDTLEDLFVFDRATNQIAIFIQQKNAQNQSSWKFAPEYTSVFPSFVNWVLLRDYDGDGEKDIFASTTFGVKVYRNTKKQTNQLGFDLAKDLLFTTGLAGGSINLNIDVTDVPAILDLDNDGDLDIVNFRSGVGSTVEWNKNLSQEQFDHSDSLIFEKVNIRWGDFEECICEQFSFDEECNTSGGRLEHAGSSLLVLNLDDNPNLDLLVGDVGCSYISALFNQNTNEDAILRNTIGRFPTQNPIDIPTFAAVFYEDVDFDGKKDLLAAPNLSSNDGNLVNFENNIWFYKNTGTNDFPNFSFIENDFLQKNTLDIGENAYPAFIDIDADGDLDMVLAERGELLGNVFKGNLHLLENIGTNQNPSFSYKDSDFLNVSLLNLHTIKPIFADFDNDTKEDLLFTAYDNEARLTKLFWIRNTGQNTPNFDIATRTEIILASTTISNSDEILVTDLNNDGKSDLLLLQNRGGIRSFLTDQTGNLILDNTNFGGFAVRRASFGLVGKNNLLLSDPENGVFLVRNFKNQTENFDLIPLLFNQKNVYTGNPVFPIGFDNHIVLGTLGGGVLWYQLPDDLVLSTESNQESLLFELYPNPASQNLIVNAKEKGVFMLVDMNGKVLIEHSVSQNLTTFNIDVSSLSTGVYIGKFIGKTTTQTLRVVVSY